MDGLFYCNNNAAQILVMEVWFPTCHRLVFWPVVAEASSADARELQNEIH